MHIMGLLRKLIKYILDEGEVMMLKISVITGTFVLTITTTTYIKNMYFKAMIVSTIEFFR